MDAGTAAVLAALIVGVLAATTQVIDRVFAQRTSAREKQEHRRAEIRDAIVEVVHQIGERMKVLDDDIRAVDAAAATNTALARLDFLLDPKDAAISGIAGAAASLAMTHPREAETTKLVGEFRRETALWYRGTLSAEEAHRAFVDRVSASLKVSGDSSVVRQIRESIQRYS